MEKLIGNDEINGCTRVNSIPIGKNIKLILWECIYKLQHADKLDQITTNSSILQRGNLFEGLPTIVLVPKRGRG